MGFSHGKGCQVCAYHQCLVHQRLVHDAHKCDMACSTKKKSHNPTVSENNRNPTISDQGIMMKKSQKNWNTTYANVTAGLRQKTTNRHMATAAATNPTALPRQASPATRPCCREALATGGKVMPVAFWS